MRSSHYRGLSRCGAQAPDAQAQQLWLTGPVAPRHAGSSQTRARTRVPCISRQTLNHCATREAPSLHFFIHFFFSSPAACSWHLPILSPHFLPVAEITYLALQPRGIRPCLGNASYTLGHCGGLCGQELLLQELAQAYFPAETWSRKQVSWRQHILSAKVQPSHSLDTVKAKKCKKCKKKKKGGQLVRK